MRIAYLDCFSGISGDMFLGALVDAGVSSALLEQTVAALNIGAKLEFSRVDRSGITATKVDVIVGGQKDMPRDAFLEHQHERPHKVEAVDPEHSHAHQHFDWPEEMQTSLHPHVQPEHEFQANELAHEHAETHEHEHTRGHSSSRIHATQLADDQSHDHVHDHGRSLKEIREIISRAPIGATARQRAIAIFEALGRAEAKIHNQELETIHFHEVGSADAIVDILCAAVGSEALAIDQWICSPLNVGGGTVKCAHGIFPVPAPATVELLQMRGAPVFSSGVQKELVTPTGAAIVSILADHFGDRPKMTLGRTGYGAGYRNLSGQANVLRLTIGEAVEHSSDSLPSSNSLTSAALENSVETITVMEATIDDMTPQMFGHFLDRAFEAGALDAFVIPVQMKKNRPGMLLTVLTRPEDRERLAKLVFSETTTIGLRIHDEQRYALPREVVTVNTRWGDVRVKVAALDGTETNFLPEYEDCRRIAAQHRIPLKNVIQESIRIYLQSLEMKNHG